RHLQKSGQEADARLVCLVLKGRRRQRQLECVPQLAGDRVLACASLDLDREAYPAVTLADGNHSASSVSGLSNAGSEYGRAHTHVDPSSIATSKSCDIPIESVVIWMEGRCCAASWSRRSRSFRKCGRAASGSSL